MPKTLTFERRDGSEETIVVAHVTRLFYGPMSVGSDYYSYTLTDGEIRDCSRDVYDAIMDALTEGEDDAETSQESG
jgi:hypothetical protein